MQGRQPRIADQLRVGGQHAEQRAVIVFAHGQAEEAEIRHGPEEDIEAFRGPRLGDQGRQVEAHDAAPFTAFRTVRSEEHTSELQSLLRTPYAVYCLKKKTNNK